jgi:hypothetical protein
MVEIWDTTKDFVGNPLRQKGITGETIIKYILEK